MSYSLVFVAKITPESGEEDDYYVELWEKNVPQLPHIEIVDFGVDPLIIRSISEGKEDDAIIIGSECVFTFATKYGNRGVYDRFFNRAYQDWKMIVRVAGQIFWVGYVQTENISMGVYEEVLYISLSASDGLKDLRAVDFLAADGSFYGGRFRLIEIIKMALTPLGLSLDFSVRLATEEINLMGRLTLFDVYADVRRFYSFSDGKMKADSCFEVIEKILAPFSAKLRQVGGKYTITNIFEEGDIWIIDWGTLLGQPHPFPPPTIIKNFEISRGGEKSLIPPLRAVEVTHRNRNLGDLPIAGNLNDFSPAGPWEINFSNFVVHPSGYLAMFFGQHEGNPPHNRNMLLKQPFHLAPISEKDYLQVQYDVWGDLGVLPPDAPDPIVRLRTHVIAPDGTRFVTNVMSVRKLTGVWTSYESPLVDQMKINVAGNYNIMFEVFIIFDGYYANYLNLELRIKNISIRRTVVGVGENEHIDFSFDTIYRFSVEGGKAVKEKELHFADAVHLGDIGAFFLEDGRPTQIWSRPGYMNNVPLIQLFGDIYISNRSRYLEYLTLDIWDVQSQIDRDTIVELDGKLYTIASYEKSVYTGKLSAKLLEFSRTPVIYTMEIIELTTVDGKPTQQIVGGLPPPGGGGVPPERTLEIDGCENIAVSPATPQTLADNRSWIISLRNIIRIGEKLIVALIEPLLDSITALQIVRKSDQFPIITVDTAGNANFGRFGINVPPAAPLHIRGFTTSGTGAVGAVLLAENISNHAGGASYNTRKARGTPSAMLPALAGDTSGGIFASFFGGANFRPGGSIICVAAENTSETSTPGRWLFQVTPSGSAAFVIRGSLESSGRWRFGDTITNYTEIDTDGTITFLGAATIFTDAPLAAHQLEPDKVLLPQFDPLLMARSFAQGVEQVAYGIITPPLGYLPGSPCTFFLDWMTDRTATGTVTWVVDYQWINVGGAQNNPQQITATSTAAGALIHQRSLIGTMPGTDRVSASSISFRLSRRGASDTFPHPVFLKCVRARFECNRLGFSVLQDTT